MHEKQLRELGHAGDVEHLTHILRGKIFSDFDIAMDPIGSAEWGGGKPWMVTVKIYDGDPQHLAPEEDWIKVRGKTLALAIAEAIIEVDKRVPNPPRKLRIVRTTTEVFEGDPEALKEEFPDEYATFLTWSSDTSDAAWLIDCLKANEELLNLISKESECEAYEGE